MANAIKLLFCVIYATIRYTSVKIISGLYYKHIMIVIDDSSVISKFEASLSDDARVVIYDRHMLIVQATGSALLVA